MTPQSNKKTRSDDAALAGLRRWLVRGTLLAGLALVAAPPSLGQVSSGGGESIGSLPGKNDPGPGEVDPSVAALPFRLVVTGRQTDLRALIVQAHGLEAAGGGSWQLTQLEVPGMARLTFEGAVELVLDRHALERSFTSFSVELGAPFAGGAVHVAAGGLRRTLPQGAQALDLHLPHLSWSGLVDGGVAVQATPPAWLSGAFGAGAGRLDITATADTVHLTQRPVLSR